MKYLRWLLIAALLGVVWYVWVTPGIPYAAGIVVVCALGASYLFFWKK
jgi:hypothetical protein